MASPEPSPFDGITAIPDVAAPALSAARPASPDPADMNMVGCIRRFIAVEARLTAIEAEEKTLKREKQELSDRVLEMMIEDGMDSPPGVDGMTAYLSPVVYVKKNIDPDTSEEFTSEDVRDALIAANLGSMIRENYNGNQLRSLLREYDEHDTRVPEPLARVVTLEKRRQLAVTPMAAKKQKAAPKK